MTSQQKGENFPTGVLVVTLLLLTIGLFNLYSATVTGAQQFFFKQLIWALIGIGIAAVVAIVDYRIYERLAYWIFGATVIMLALTLTQPTVKGSHRWLQLGFMNLQPSVLMWFVISLMLARWFHDNVAPKKGYLLRELKLPIFLTALPAGLILLQPDLGTTMLMIAVAGTIFLFAKIRLRTLIMLALLAMIALPVVWKFGLKDYQRKRVENLLSPDEDIRGAGYHRRQSIIAIGSGKVWGKGFTGGTQSQLRFLPEQHTDFIFSVWAEEHGFMGSVVLLGLYGYLFFASLIVSRRAREKFGALIVLGATSLLFFQTLINIGMVLGILPVVGIPLPFLSYGGTALIIDLICVAIVLNVGMRRYMF